MNINLFFLLFTPNLNYLVFISIFILFFLFIFFLILFFLRLKILNIYYLEILNFNREFNDNNIDLKEFYNKLLLRKTNLIGLSFIFFSGFKEFIYLHRKGISDVVIITKVVKKVMKTCILKELNFVNNSIKIFKIFNFLYIYIILFLTTFSIIFFFQELESFFYFNNIFIDFLNISIIFLPILFGLVVLIVFNFILIKINNILSFIKNNYEVFINEFIVLLYHKLYN